MNKVARDISRKDIFIFFYFSELIAINIILDYLWASGGKYRPFCQRDKIWEEHREYPDEAEKDFKGT